MNAVLDSVVTLWGQVAYLFLDEALGEYDVETRIGLIEVLPLEAHPDVKEFRLPIWLRGLMRPSHLSSNDLNKALCLMELSARLNPGEGLGDRVLKVNHAGEHGAVNIYAGQILFASLTARDMLAQLREFQSHEMRHREIFASELRRRGLRRCRSYSLCAVGGYFLGCITGLFGRSAIAATTVAVEEVVLRHLEQQIQALAQDESAVLAISRIIEDERAHHDVSREVAAASRFWVGVLSPVVAFGTEAVIWLGMRI